MKKTINNIKKLFTLVNKKTNGTLYWGAYFGFNTLLLVAFHMSDITIIVPTIGAPFFKTIIFFMINNIILSIFILLFAVLCFIFIEIFIWFKRDLSDAFKQAFKEIYGVETKLNNISKNNDTSNPD